MKKNENQSNFQEGDAELLGGYVNTPKAKQLLTCGSTTLYYLREREKVLAYTKVGNKIFYSIESIQKLLDKNRRGGENATN
jgi:hypothetical protein